MDKPTSEPEIKYDPKQHNVYANRIDGSYLHISEAESGQNGYYCQGCGKELVAVKSKLPNRIHFFRHAALDVQIERRCVYRDFHFRHNLAIELVAIQKYLRVPAVYKYPPSGTDGIANLISEAQVIEAESVERQIAFYENEIGEIKWGPKQGVDEKYLLVVPDVIFFDKNQKPILFVELAASHKVDNEKKAKLRRLGINSVEITIPKDSPAAIEAAIRSTKNTKWLYNNEEEHTHYVPISQRDSEGIPPIDEQQERLFAETFECRQAEVRNLIRTITRVLESQHYGNIVQQLGTEISRVEDNTEPYKSRLEEIRGRHRKAVADRFAERRNTIDGNRTALEVEEETLGAEEANLEKRYTAKKRELRESEESITKEQKYVERRLKGYDGEPDGVGDSNYRIKEDLERLIQEEESIIRRFEQDLEKAPGEYNSEEEGINEKIRDFADEENGEIGRIETELRLLPEGFEEDRKRIVDEFKFKEEQLPGEFGAKGAEIERKFEELRKQSHQTIMSRNGTGNSEAAARIRKLLEARGILADIEPTQKLYRRYRKAWKCFTEGAYESWNK